MPHSAVADSRCESTTRIYASYNQTSVCRCAWKEVNMPGRPLEPAVTLPCTAGIDPALAIMFPVVAVIFPVVAVMPVPAVTVVPADKAPFVIAVVGFQIMYLMHLYKLQCDLQLLEERHYPRQLFQLMTNFRQI